MNLEKWPDQFDCVIANPPYSKQQHLKFLDKAIDLSKGEVLFVHPSNWLVDNKGLNKIFKETRNKTRPFIKELTLFNGNPVFNISIFLPCVITHLDKKSANNDSFRYIDLINQQDLVLAKDKLEDISVFGYRKEFISFRDKIMKYLEINQNLEELNEGKRVEK